MDNGGVEEQLAGGEERGVVGAKGGPGEAEKEDHGVGEVDVEVEDTEHDSLHLNDVVFLVGVLSEVDECGELSRVILFCLAGDPERCCPNKLQLVRVKRQSMIDLRSWFDMS